LSVASPNYLPSIFPPDVWDLNGAVACKLNISERSVYYLIKLMKKLDAPIYYSRNRQSYCYKEEVTFTIGFIKTLM